MISLLCFFLHISMLFGYRKKSNQRGRWKSHWLKNMYSLPFIFILPFSLMRATTGKLNSMWKPTPLSCLRDKNKASSPHSIHCYTHIVVCETTQLQQQQYMSCWSQPLLEFSTSVYERLRAREVALFRIPAKFAAFCLLM